MDLHTSKFRPVLETTDGSSFLGKANRAVAEREMMDVDAASGTACNRQKRNMESMLGIFYG